MDILKQNFDNTVRQRFGQTIEALESAFKLYNLDYYLIGAFVREVWTDHVTGLPVKSSELYQSPILRSKSYCY